MGCSHNKNLIYVTGLVVKQNLATEQLLYAFPRWLSIKDRLPMQETQVQSLGPEDPLEEEMATPSSILAWKIPWTEEPGRLQSVELQSQKRQTNKHTNKKVVMQEMRDKKL